MKFCISLKTFEKNLIYQILPIISINLQKNNSKILGTVFLPKKIKKFCVLRSPHIDKSSREHFEIRSYKCLIYIEIISLNCLNNFLKIEMPSGLFCDLLLV
jgi:small subunit ribosomal protein S10